MVKLAVEDIDTREVLDWKGVHLFHFWVSSCSQKTRIFLNLKEGDWTSHEINLPQQENFSPWYLGINPRGLVPCLVHNGEVHIESNDIIQYLEEHYGGRPLIPHDMYGRVDELLRHENDMHFDLRNLTFRYFLSDGSSPISFERLDDLRKGGTGTVKGAHDSLKDREIDYWANVLANKITDDVIRESANRFRLALDQLDGTLADTPFVLGRELSVVDIAWYVYANRLLACGYPLSSLHPQVAKWFDSLDARDEFRTQVAVPPELLARAESNQAKQSDEGRSLRQVMAS